jgi:endo-1,4-beta-xylanase
MILSLGSLKSAQEFQSPGDPELITQTISVDPRLFIYPRFSSVKLTKEIKFAEVTGYKGVKTELLLDIYEPENDNTASRPVIVWIHGGGFRTGSVRTQNYIVKYCNDFAKRGYVCVSIDYRLRDSKDMPDKRAEFPALQDAARDANTALDWVRTNSGKYRIDPSLIFVAGGSAGGRTALTVSQFPGPDPAAKYEPEIEYKSKPWNKSGIIAVASLWGGPEPELRDWIYPFLQKNCTPALFIHGDADSTINVINSINLYDAMKGAGIPAEIHIMKGKPHTPSGKDTDPLIEDWIAKFFVRQWEAPLQSSFTADPAISKAIELNRKGDLIIKAKKGSTVKVEQLRHDFWFGCAIANNLAGGSWSVETKRMYKEKFLENFNSAVTENAVKWGTMEPRKGEVNYRIIDTILKFTDENKMPLRGHNIFWGIPQFVQPWVKELSDTDLKLTLQNRAETLGARYKGRFAEYDLNNEMIHGNYYEDRLGPDITRLMAQWVHNGDPGAKLWVNDYDILTGNRLADYMKHIRTLVSQGVPVAGIGVQGHLHGESFDRFALRNALDSLAKFNLPVRVTEFNLPGQRSKYYNQKITTMTPDEEQQKAKDIVDYYTICFSHPAVEGILMWGFWEGANWIPVSSLYKRDWTPTPAAEAYKKLIFSDWWTNVSGKTGKDRITVNGVTKEVDLSKAKGSVVVEFKSK